MSAAPVRRLLVCLLAAIFASLLAAARAEAGYGVSPNGHSFDVTVDQSGAVSTPSSLDFVVYLDSHDSDPYVWISESPEISSSRTPVGPSVGSCSPSSLIPFGEPGKWICRAGTTMLRPGRMYYWWLDFSRREEGSSSPQGRVSGPFPFTLVERAVAPLPPPPDPHPPTLSSKTVAAAATLPAADRFAGRRSLKHRTLTQLIYRTMRQLGVPRTLAIACWNEADWLSVVQAEGEEPEHGTTMLLGFWKPVQPRWLHIAPTICTDIQALLDTKAPSGRRAAALATVMHETLHAYGFVSEAQTNCYAVQLVPLLGLNLKMSDRRASYLGQLALRFVRSHAPSGYWNGSHCRDGGRWDLLPSLINLR